MAVYI